MQRENLFDSLGYRNIASFGGLWRRRNREHGSNQVDASEYIVLQHR